MEDAGRQIVHRPAPLAKHCIPAATGGTRATGLPLEKSIDATQKSDAHSSKKNSKTTIQPPNCLAGLWFTSYLVTCTGSHSTSQATTLRTMPLMTTCACH